MNNFKTSKQSLLLKFALGAALAASAGYAYFTHKEEIDAEAKKRFHQLAKVFRQSKAEVEKRVKKIWGEVNHEAVATYLDVRANLLHALENEQLKKGEKMLKEHYEKLVDLVVTKAKKSGLLKVKNHGDLASVLKSDWKQVQKVMTENVKKAGKNVRSSLKSAQGTAKKLGSNAAKKAVKAVKKVEKAAKKRLSK